MNTCQLILLTAALSLDTLTAGFLYGADRVRIPFVSLMILSGLSAGILALFLFLGSWLQVLLPPKLPSLLCFLILLILGCIKLFDGTVKSLTAAANGPDISILSPGEAFSLGIALAMDSAAAGLGTGFASFPIPTAFLLSFLFTAAALTVGSLLGQRLSKRIPCDFSWLAGCLLLALAFFKLP